MTIAAITTFGFITGSTVSRAVTLGYGAGSAPPATAGSDNFLPYSRADIKRYRAKLKRDQEAREIAYAEKLAEANSVRSEIDRILHPPAEDFVEKAAKSPATPTEPLPDLAKLTAKQRRAIADLKRQLGVLMAEAHILEEQERVAAREARRQKDEMEMQVIAALYNAAITGTLH